MIAQAECERLAKLVSKNTGMIISFVYEEHGMFVFERKTYKSYTRIGLSGNIEHVGHESDKWHGPGEEIYRNIRCSRYCCAERNLTLMAEKHLTCTKNASFYEEQEQRIERND